MKLAGAGLAVAAVPGSIRAALSGLSDAEIEEKVKGLVSQMTLDEKIEQMHGTVGLVEGFLQLSGVNKLRYTWNTPENKKRGIPAFRMVDGPRGSALGHSTCFPVGILRGATWDPEIEERVATAMGYETRAQGGNVHLSPCINLVRHPSGGRNQETFGEDQYHVGVMGVAQTVGLQHHVMACPKHYAVNNIEGNRFKVDARLDERVLREIYLVQFRMCVEAGAASIMSSYNDVNGHLAGQNKHLCREILKEEWGFEGFVVSDWANAVDDAVAAAHGGLDIEMPMGMNYGRKLKKAVKQGKVSRDLIDQSVTRLLRMKFKFITDNMQSGYSMSKVAGKEHTELALETAQKGIVLLKNDDSALPLCRKEVKTIAVLGELADFPNIGDHGSSSVNPPYVVTPLEGIKNRAGSVTIIHEDGKSLARAKQAAKDADAVIVVAGATFEDEGEGGGGRGDRLDLNLHQQDADLIDAVAGETDRLIVVLEAGAAITLEQWKDKPQAILMAWYPGMEGGNAIADVIFGNVNPSGKLPVTFHKSEDQLPSFDNRVDFIDYDYWHGYRLFEKEGHEPSYPFGFGLSYTEYKYKNLRLDKKKTTKCGKITASVDVTNTGDKAGEEIVQLYAGYKDSAVYRSKKDLKGFARVALEPGETKTVSIEIKPKDLAFWCMKDDKWVVEEIEYIVYIGPSSKREDLLSDTFRVSG
jgi:beta-glucosidase